MSSADAMRPAAYKGGEFLPTSLTLAAIGAVVVMVIVLALRRRNQLSTYHLASTSRHFGCVGNRSGHSVRRAGVM
jgi:uncharacterized OsmC-like protein